MSYLPLTMLPVFDDNNVQHDSGLQSSEINGRVELTWNTLDSSEIFWPE